MSGLQGASQIDLTVIVVAKEDHARSHLGGSMTDEVMSNVAMTVAVTNVVLCLNTATTRLFVITGRNVCLHRALHLAVIAGRR